MYGYVRKLYQAMIGLLLLCLLSSCGTREKQEITIERGDCIIAAIKSHYVANNKYPQSLDQLVPNYIERIDEPLVGRRKWVYALYEDRDLFNLGVEPVEDYSILRPSLNISMWYSSKKGRWSVDTH